jgi:hypothetical protein
MYAGNLPDYTPTQKTVVSSHLVLVTYGLTVLKL